MEPLREARPVPTTPLESSASEPIESADFPKPKAHAFSSEEGLFPRTVTHVKARKGWVNWIVHLFLKIFTNYKVERAEDLYRDAQGVVDRLAANRVVDDSEELLHLKSDFLNPEGLDFSELPNHSHIRAFSKQKVAEREFVPSIVTGGITLIPYTRVGENLESGKVTGTALRSSTHLANLYVSSNHIRCGVINSKGKAEDFMDAVRLARPEGKVRVVVNQLNSLEKGEAKFVRNEHKLLAGCATSEIEIAHLNTPTNRFYEFNLAAKKILPERLVDYFLPGEKKSKYQNLDSLALLALWQMEDLEQEEPLAVEGRGDLARLKELHRESQDLLKKLYDSDLKQERVGLRSSLETNRHEVRTILEKRLALCKTYSEDPSISVEWQNRFRLMEALLGSQLSVEGYEISRAKEQLIIKLLNHELGVLSAVNCKSGLDRTGQSSAAELALKQMLENPDIRKEAVVEMVLGWDKESLLPTSHYVEEFRKLCLKNMIQGGLPITFYSTGMLGLKWGKGQFAQLTPLHYIPPEILIDGQRTKLVNYDARGYPSGLTSQGHRLLTRFSSLRGA